MVLRRFTSAVRQEWIDEGFDSVKITSSDHTSVNNESEPYFLLEPNNLQTDIGDGNMVQNISAPIIQEIIIQGTGRFYQ